MMWCVVFGGVGAVRTAVAQQPQAPSNYMEYRADAIITRGTALQAGLGAVFAAGTYVRFSLDGAAGATESHGTTQASGRIDAIGRFLLDPFREIPVAISVGGGLSVPFVDRAPVRPYLTAVLDIEGRKRGRVTPALQLGLGGGARVGVVLRTSPVRWR